MLYKALVLSILLYASPCSAPFNSAYRAWKTPRKSAPIGLAWIMNVPWKD